MVFYIKIYHCTERLPHSNSTLVSYHYLKKGIFVWIKKGIYSVFCKEYSKKGTYAAPGNVIRASQFSVGTVFIQDLCDMMCLPACSSRFPNSLSEKHNKQREREREKKTNVSHFAMLLWSKQTRSMPFILPLAPSAKFKCHCPSPWNMRRGDITECSSAGVLTALRPASEY